MWHLLKAEWSNKILPYLLAVALPHFLMKDRYFTENTEKAKVVLVAFILACIIAGLVMMTIVEAARNGNNKPTTGMRFHTLLPLSLNQQYFVRLLTGSLFVTVFLTVEGTLYLFSIRSRIGDHGSHWIVLTSGMIIISCQLIIDILSNLSTRGSLTWLSNQTVQILIFMSTSVIFTFASIFFQIHREQFFGSTDTIVCTIFALCIMWISLKTFLHRKSFLR